MYVLYHNRDKCELKLSKATKVWERSKVNLIEGVPYYYNTLYTLCTDRKALKQRAIEIKMLWLAEAQMLVQQIEAIKI